MDQTTVTHVVHTWAKLCYKTILYLAVNAHNLIDYWNNQKFVQKIVHSYKVINNNLDKYSIINFNS